MNISKAEFFGRVAPTFAEQVAPGAASVPLKSKRFTYFGDSDNLVLIVPPEDKDPDWALVYGLAERRHRRLHLVLPREDAFPSMQRVPWLIDEARPVVWTYEGRALRRARVLDREQTKDAVRRWADRKGGAIAELTAASTPDYLGDRKAAVQDLAEWATKEPQLDAAHRQSERSWHAAGQRVLTFSSTKSGVLKIVAGIQDKAGAHHKSFVLGKNDSLSSSELVEIQGLVRAAITLRLNPNGPYRPDEHWLQSVLRRDPSLVGVESPALREVPAWRPKGITGNFSRGYLDLVGLDGQGDIRIVEAKIAKSGDELTLFQGIDYYVWGSAYLDALRTKLSAPPESQLHVTYVVGRMDGVSHLFPKRLASYASALDVEAIPFQFHVVDGWQSWTPDARPSLRSTPMPLNQLPA